MTDFVSQNIVYSLSYYHGMDIDVDEIKKHLDWASSLSDSTSYLDESRMKLVIEKIRTGQSILLVLEPSWGARVVAVFKTVE
jgi:hypothetical protein